VVDNNSHENSKQKLKILEKKLTGKLLIITNSENLGSSGGFKKGFEKAYELNYDYIWSLDDDNVVEKEAYKVISNFWKKNNLNGSKSMLVSLRKDRKNYYNSIVMDDQTILIGTQNSFMQFDICRYIKNKLFPMKLKRDYDEDFGKVIQAPYGGMFFHKSLLDEIGFPNEKYFVYHDDTEFSYRLIKKGGIIYALMNSAIYDIDTSWHDTKSHKTPLYNAILDSESDFRIYYSFRNRVVFEINNRVDNKFFYLFNMTLFLMKLFFLSILKLKFRRFLLICNAINDGFKNIMGKVEKFDT
jgi:GT2 family glycosyltransferase